MDKSNPNSRTNKSQRIAKGLKTLSGSPISIIMPASEELEEAGKHIEWLELVLTGVSYADRNTIARLSTKIKRQARMIKDRDHKIARHDLNIRKLKQEHKMTLTKNERRHRREVAQAKHISREERHNIEKKFIKSLQTGFQKGNALSQARWEGAHSPKHSGGTSSTYNDGGWKQYTTT